MDNLRDAAFSFADIAQNLSENLLEPWIAYQIAIAIGVFVVAYFLTTPLKARFHNWMRARRLADVAYAYPCDVASPFAFAGLCLADLDHFAGDARNHMALALLFDRDHRKSNHIWFFVAFVKRFIHNSLLRAITRYGTWIWVTLSIVNLTNETQELLENITFEHGTMRLSLWTVVQALVILAILFASAQFISTVSTATIRKNDEISPSIQVLAIEFLQKLLYGSAFFIGIRTVGLDLTGLAFQHAQLVSALVLVCKRWSPTLCPALSFCSINR
ncbi:hypothetical protein [Planktotalea sp.]|uniref:hypothetical protein n=1 Tax=Planktotalea sp. TaxID=2029877 RepID=UPI0034281B32